MKNDVKIRHVIAYDSKNDKFYLSSFGRRVRQDEGLDPTP